MFVFSAVKWIENLHLQAGQKSSDARRVKVDPSAFAQDRLSDRRTPVVRWSEAGKRNEADELFSPACQTPGKGIMFLNLATVFSRSSLLERLTFGNLSFHSNGRTA
jgi:hypothetical protein